VGVLFRCKAAGVPGLIASFTFATEHANILMGLLPPLLHIRSHADRAVMQWYMERMIVVLRNPQARGSAPREYLSQMIADRVLRLHVTQKCPERVGWLCGLASSTAACHTASGSLRPMRPRAAQLIQPAAATGRIGSRCGRGCDFVVQTTNLGG